MKKTESGRNTVIKLFGLVGFFFVVTVGLFWGPIQIYQYLLIITSIVMCAAILMDPIVIKNIFNLNILLFAILIEVILVNMANGINQINQTMKLVFLVLSSFGLAISFRNEYDFVIVTRWIIFGVVCSSVVAICQIFGFEWAYTLWKVRNYSDAYRATELLQFIQNGRAAGLAPYTLDFGFQIIQVLPLCMVLVRYYIENKYQKILYSVLTIIIILGCIASGMRMAILICLFQIVLIFGDEFLLRIDRRKIGWILGSLVGIICIMFYIENRTGIISSVFMRFSLLSSESGKGSIRILTLKHYLSTLYNMKPIKWLFGNGYQSMNQYRLGTLTLGSGHNFIISNLFEYGLVGFGIVVIFYSKLLGKLKYFIKEIPAIRGILISIGSYLIVSLTNDSNLLDADFFHIIIIVIAIGLCSCAEKNKREE